MPPPPRKFKPEPSDPRYACVVRHCSKCGHGLIIASGLHAHDYDTQKVIQALLIKGWKLAPRLLCRSCACPMDFFEMSVATRLFNDLKPRLSGSEFRQFEYDEFKAQMIAKRGPECKRFFDSMRKEIA